MRIELAAWVLVHGAGVLVNAVGIVLSLRLGMRPGRQAVPVLRGLSAVCALLIHAVSVVVGTAVVAALPPGQVWGYAIFQGALFLTIGGVNTLIGYWEWGGDA